MLEYEMNLYLIFHYFIARETTYSLLMKVKILPINSQCNATKSGEPGNPNVSAHQLFGPPIPLHHVLLLPLRRPRRFLDLGVDHHTSESL